MDMKLQLFQVRVYRTSGEAEIWECYAEDSEPARDIVYQEFYLGLLVMILVKKAADAAAIRSVSARDIDLACDRWLRSRSL